jgi:hypothetical protein
MIEKAKRRKWRVQEDVRVAKVQGVDSQEYHRTKGIEPRLRRELATDHFWHTL